MNIKLTKEQKIKILNSGDLYKVMQQILLRENKIRRNQEHFWIIGLNIRNKLLFVELIGLGTVNRVAANPPDIFRMAIYKLAAKIVLVHNHPSKEVDPSKADLEMTDRMLKIGQLINIEVIDHLIISEEKYTSLADLGIMDQFIRSGMFEIVEREKEQIKEWKLDIEKKQAERNKALEIARRLKSAGMEEKVIKKMTGLYMHEIRKL